MMSPYSFHQFWLNVEDEKVGELLRVFTFLGHEEIEALEKATAEEPWKRAGQRALADEVTTLVHGAAETEQARTAAAALFGTGDLHDLGPATLAAALREAGTVRARPGLDVVDLLVESGLVRSKGEARRTVAEGGAYVNNQRVTDPELVPGRDQLLHGCWLVLRRGKKHLAGVEVVPTGADQAADLREPGL
jgi:tyrosyl-tRNA synthetase